MAENPPITAPVRRGPGALPALLLALGFLPGMLAYLLEAWQKPWYRWYPLALAAALALAAWAARAPRAPAAPGNRWVWLPWLGAGLALLALAAGKSSAWLAWLAGLLALAGALGWGGGWALLRLLLPSWVLLAVVLAPPFGWDDLVVQRLERMILSGASHVLYGLSVPHLLYPGGVALAGLKLPQQELFAGLYGLPGVLAAGLIWLLAWRRGPVRVCFTLLVTAALLLPGEVLRVVWGIAASDAQGADQFVLPKSRYWVMGLWAASFVLFLSVDQFMRFLLSPRRKPDLPPAAPEHLEPPGVLAGLGLGGRGSGVSWAMAGLALVLGMAQGAACWRKTGAETAVAAPAPPSLRGDARFALPDWPEWRSLLGSNSLAQPVAIGPARGVWHRQRHDLAVGVCLSGPAPGFTTPIPAYQEALWRLSGWAPVGSAGSTPPPFAEAELKRDSLFHGLLWFGVLDESGQWLAPSVRGAWSGAAREPAARAPRATYLVQVLAVCPRNFTTTEREEVRRHFEDARQALARQLASQLASKP